MVPIDFHSIPFPSIEVNGNKQLLGYSEFFKKIYFVFNIRRCETTYGWVNDDKIFTFGWTVPLTCTICKICLCCHLFFNITYLLLLLLIIFLYKKDSLIIVKPTLAQVFLQLEAQFLCHCHRRSLFSCTAVHLATKSWSIPSRSHYIIFFPHSRPPFINFSYEIWTKLALHLSLWTQAA